MAVTNKLSLKFAEEFANLEHNLNGSVNLKAILLDTSFVFDPATHGSFADISADELATNYGYTQKTLALANVSLVTTGGVTTLNADNLTWTAFGGSIGPTVACAIINDAHTDDTVICCIEFGAQYVATTGTALTVDLSSGVFTLTANPA